MAQPACKHCTHTKVCFAAYQVRAIVVKVSGINTISSTHQALAPLKGSMERPLAKWCKHYVDATGSAPKER